MAVKKITLKTLQQQTFTVDIEESESVKNLKEKIETVKGAENFPVVGQKLIYAGKILEDEKTIKECNIEQNNFVVVMVTKPKAAPKPAETKPVEAAAPAAVAIPAPAATPAPVAPTQPAETKEETKEEKKEEEEPAAAAASATPAATAMETTSSTTASTGTTNVQEASNSLATGSKYEKAIENLLEMGFPRDMVLRAMSQAYNCPDRAADYLLSGMVSNEPVAVEPPASSPQQQTAPTGTTQARVPVPDENPLAFLRDQPHFRQMRELVQSNPSQLQPLLQQIGQGNPDLLRLINDNQQTFVNMLNEPLEGSGGGGGGSGGGGSGGVGANLPMIQITPEDKAAIDNLIAMGFSEAHCIQAYFACEKDEELAANFLMEEMLDDDESAS